MKRILLASALFLGAALLLAHLASSRPRLAPLAIERLLGSEAGAARSVSALTIAAPEGGELAYIRARGLWRSREAFGAVCQDAALEELVRVLTQARGLEVTREPALAERYGFAPGRLVRIALHGAKFLEREDRDTFFALELGGGFDEGPVGRAFARRGGSSAILEIDCDPRRLLAPPASGLPPLVDTRLLAGCFGAGFVGFRRLEFARSDGSSFALRSEPSSDPKQPPQWTLERGGQSEPALVWRVGGFTSLWIRARAKGYGDPRQARELGLEQPWLELTLTPSEGEPIRICLSERGASNEAWLWNRRTNVLMRVDGELWRDLGTEPADFVDALRPNRWERWLTR